MKEKFKFPIEPTPVSFHTRLTDTLHSLPAANYRKHASFPLRRTLVVAALFLALMGSSAVSTRVWDVGWFERNRLMAREVIDQAESWSVSSISYDGQYLAAELNDVVWNRTKLELELTYSLSGLKENARIANQDYIGVDGERFSHIWTGDEILPVEEWANGQPIYTYFLECWRIGGEMMRSSSDMLPDGLGETRLDMIRMDDLAPEEYACLLDEDGLLTLEGTLWITDYETGDELEQGTLTVRVSAPSLAEWQAAYDTHQKQDSDLV